MSIKIILLKSGENIISDAKELISDEQVCGYLLNKPHKVFLERPVFLSESMEPEKDTISVTLTPWIPLSSEEQIPISPDWIVTVVEPIENIREMYLEKIGEKK